MTGRQEKPNPAETAEARKRLRPAACDRCHVEKAVVLIDEGRQNQYKCKKPGQQIESAKNRWPPKRNVC
jgi:hypothetical protein